MSQAAKSSNAQTSTSQRVKHDRKRRGVLLIRLTMLTCKKNFKECTSQGGINLEKKA